MQDLRKWNSNQVQHRVEMTFPASVTATVLFIHCYIINKLLKSSKTFQLTKNYLLWHKSRSFICSDITLKLLLCREVLTHLFCEDLLSEQESYLCQRVDTNSNLEREFKWRSYITLKHSTSKCESNVVSAQQRGRGIHTTHSSHILWF